MRTAQVPSSDAAGPSTSFLFAAGLGPLFFVVAFWAAAAAVTAGVVGRLSGRSVLESGFWSLAGLWSYAGWWVITLVVYAFYSRQVLGQR